jgi:hypothetical protein
VSDTVGAVDITFRQLRPSDELLYYIRRHCRRADAQHGHTAAWWVLVAHEQGRGRYRVRVQREGEDGRAEVVQVDPDPFLAVRNAFSVLTGAEAGEAGRADCTSGIFEAFDGGDEAREVWPGRTVGSA